MRRFISWGLLTAILCWGPALSAPSAASGQEPYPSVVGDQVRFDSFAVYNWETFRGFSYHPSSAAVGEFQADDVVMPGFGLGFFKLREDFSHSDFFTPSVSGLTLTNHSNLALEHDRDGNIHIFWQAVEATEGSEPALYFRRYDPQGEPIDDGRQVNQTTLDDSLWLQVIVDGDGDTTLVWRSVDEVKMRRISSVGVPLDNEFSFGPLDGFTGFAGDADGNLLRVYVAADADGDGIFGRRFSAAGVPIGDAFAINDHTADNQTAPAMDVAPDGSFAIAWRSESSPGTSEPGPHAHFRLFDPQGVPVASELRLGRSTGHRGVAFFNTPEEEAVESVGPEPWRLLTIWMEDDFVRGQYVSTAGAPIGDPIQIDTAPVIDQYPVSTPYLDSHGGNELMVVWRRGFNWANGSSTVGWVLSADQDSDMVADRLDNCLTIANPGQWDWDDDGPGDFCDSCLGDDALGDADSDGVCADLDCDPSNTAAAYVDGCGVCGGDNSTCVEETVVNDDPGLQTRPDLATGALGDFVIVWESVGSPGPDDDGFSVQAQRYNRDGEKLGQSFQVNEYTTGNQFLPSAAVARDGSFVVVWESQVAVEDTTSTDIWARFYDSSGAAVTGEMLVNNWTDGSQRFAEVATQGDDQFIVTWGGVADASNDFDVNAQRFDTAGQELGQELRVVSFDGTQTLPVVGSAANGDFVIAWTSNRSETYYNIYFQRYRSDGVSMGSRTRVDAKNEYSAGNRYSPGVLMAEDGSFVVTWASDFSDDSGLAAMAERFSSDGVSQGNGSFRLNAYTSQDQRSPAVAWVEGKLVGVWESQGSLHSPGSDYSIQARAYEVDDPVGSTAFQVTGAAGDQRYPQIARSWDHGFRVVWVDYSDADRTIRMRHFDGPGLFLDGFESGDMSFWSAAP